MRRWLDYLQMRLADYPDGLPAVPVYRRTYMDVAFFGRAYELFDRAEKLCEPGSEEHVRVLGERMPVDTALLGRWPILERGLVGRNIGSKDVFLEVIVPVSAIFEEAGVEGTATH